ncbi:MAG: ABC transporter ATP-binding protein [Bdellovibrionales bacterium]|nr:ABC transporter ATP-binding protein [Bdellovibrionales bacterium]
MSQAAIEFANVAKSFQTWHERPHSLKEVLGDLMMLRLKAGCVERTSVLRNINLCINKGDFVGIMGRNGVGKSTLLKMIAGVYRPTEGTIHTHGKIAPLLELGAGFAPELSGLENIYLNASILGFGHNEVNRKINEILEFSELKEAINRPVRNYSSGMLVRLGFSIAVHLNADLLLFDEILAVGDVGFQNKCLQKIDELHKLGKTIILVTHIPEQVEAFCSRCIVLDQEGVIYDGLPNIGAENYRHLFHQR